MPFAALDLLLALAPTGVLLTVAWLLRRLLTARPTVEHAAIAANARPAPEPDSHADLVPAYAPADA